METWFSKALIRWYNQFKRDLPWRHESDPYKIWLSEVILQQTQVAQGLSYYYTFTKAYPTVKHLANAPEDEVLRHWQGLGYYSRARNLHSAAKAIVSNHNGQFPQSYTEIRALKGVGDYTAAAIASFAYNLPYAVLDGNVYRVLSRVFGILTPIDSGSAKKQFQELADQLLDRKQAGEHNQAIMEFGSQQCKPANPDCVNCIFRTRCFANQNNLVDTLPAKEKKIKIKSRYFNYIVMSDSKKNVIVQKRDKKDIWQGLYEFPVIETNKSYRPEELFRTKAYKEICGSAHRVVHESSEYKHILSHQHLYARFYVVKLKGRFQQKRQTAVKQSKLSDYAFPRLIGRFLEDCSLKEML